MPSDYQNEDPDAFDEIAEIIGADNAEDLIYRMAPRLRRMMCAYLSTASGLADFEGMKEEGANNDFIELPTKPIRPLKKG